MSRGFILWVVMFICFSISGIMLVSWRRASQLLDLTHARILQHKRFYLAQLLLNYGVSLVKNGLRSEGIIDGTSLLKSLNIEYDAKVRIELQNKDVLVKSELIQDGHCVYNLRCLVGENGDVKGFTNIKIL